MQMYKLCKTPGFFKTWTIHGLFFFIFAFSMIQLVENFVDKTLPMTGFKLRVSGVGNNRYNQLSHNHCPKTPGLAEQLI